MSQDTDQQTEPNAPIVVPEPDLEAGPEGEEAPSRSFTERIRESVERWLRQRRRQRAARGSKRAYTKVLALTLLALFAAFGWALAYQSPAIVGDEIRLDALSSLADDGRVVRASFRDEDAVVVGEFACALPKGKDAPSSAIGCTDEAAESAPFTVRYPKSGLTTAALMQTLVDSGARVVLDPQTTKAQVRIVSTFLLPLMILANLFALLFTGGKGGGGGIGEVELFGSMQRGRVRRKRNATPVTFRDVGGADEAVAELREVVDYLRDPTRYREIGAMAPKGVLMIGPPGCGKTLLARAAAGEANVPFFSVAGAEFVESLVGVGAARVRDLFQRVRAAAPAIVFIDELDAAGRKRGVGGGSGGSDEREQTLNQLLVEMDGFEATAGIVVVGATNRPDILDPALLRPGRFDRQIAIERPDLAGRASILALHARGRKLAEDVDVEGLAERCTGFSGADLANAVNEAALLAVRAGKERIEAQDLSEGIERVRQGPQRRGRILSDDARQRAAAHEAGHAIVGAAMEGKDAIHRLTLLRGTNTLAATTLTLEAGGAVGRSALRARLITVLGGLAGEEMIFGEPSTGAESDLEIATGLARDMVARYGMSTKLGRARLLASDVDEFLDIETAMAPLAPDTQLEVDGEIRTMLAAAEDAARVVLADNEEVFVALANRLLQHETLEGEALHGLLGRISHVEVADAWPRTARARTRAPRAKASPKKR